MHVRTIVNRIISRYGYEITKIDKFKQYLIEEYNRDDDFCFIQIGANDGVSFDELYSFVTSRKCRGVVVEPLKIYFEKLKQNYSRYPDIIPVNCAVHQNKKKAVLHYVDPAKLDLLPEWVQGIGSLDPNHYKQSGLPSDYIVSEEVECVHLMELIRDNKFEHVNLLQIDVEGYDGEVIKMIDFDVIRPKMIKYEHQSLKKEEQQEITILLESHGYEVFIHGNDSIAIDSSRTMS
ncbi:methyltransferase FkbM family [Geobacter metallireducens RCH3]|uniref:Methyltransferase FkbM domain-containing protein n=1 Tax=Geobacter metallireducens (strain ATCC 53774 / DSM 7210 / GS-15) TaxID=269799 RepID=Q39T64_GEOMG|nr:FkbM family methyltransferase [Geobacter metallireducens]ABB32560.1 hypothetical protein Gmet_2335 [Geobacter metallireducens GS-15]EHP86413.1 methyltransferase FkbM family [Geobacter metallireducens RCH3]